MRHPYALPFLLFAQLPAMAQQINNVQFSPNNPNECQLVDLNLIGSMPQNGNFTSFAPPPPNNDTLLLAVSAEGPTGAGAGFNQELPGLGPFAPGTYVFIVNFNYNGNLADTWQGTLVVSPGFDPDPGEFAQVTLCNSDPEFPLLSVLGGTPDPGGVWYDPNNQVVDDGIFVPGQSIEGPYSYVFDVFPPCQDAFQQLVILYTPNSNPGLNATVQACSNGQGAVIDLYDALGGTPETGGAWTFNGNPHGPTFVPGTDNCGVYTYTVEGIAPCGDPSATITVQCVNPPNAGNNAPQPLYLCYDDSSQVLQGNITGEQNTGIWIDQNGFGIVGFNQPINVALYGSGLYGYMVSGGGVCPNDTSFVQVILLGDTIVGCTIGMDESSEDIRRFDLMPNPAQDQVTIELELARVGDARTIELIDVNGAVVHREVLRSNGLLVRRTIPLAGLAKGVYVARVSSQEGALVRRLVVK